MESKGSVHFHLHHFSSSVSSSVLTSPFCPASLSLARTTATFSPMGVFSVMSTEVSDVMSNTGLLSFSSRMVIETCWEMPSEVIQQEAAHPSLRMNQSKLFCFQVLYRQKTRLTFCKSNEGCSEQKREAFKLSTTEQELHNLERSRKRRERKDKRDSRMRRTTVESFLGPPSSATTVKVYMSPLSLSNRPVTVMRP